MRTFTFMSTLIPSVDDGDNAGLPVSNLHECGLGHVKMGARRIAPATIIGVLGPIWRAKVCGCNCCERYICIAMRRIMALYLITSPTSVSIVEQRRAQCRCVCPVSINPQVSIPASSTCESRVNNILTYSKTFMVKHF